MTRVAVGLALSARSLEDSLRRHEFVYYVRHHGVVKIGTTTNLIGRLRALRANATDLLAYEFGGRDLERKRHEQFQHLRAEGPGLGREHFTPAPELTEHMEALMADARDRVLADARHPWHHSLTEDLRTF